jgi:hypothetical protein
MNVAPEYGISASTSTLEVSNATRSFDGGVSVPGLYEIRSKTMRRTLRRCAWVAGCAVFLLGASVPAPAAAQPSTATTVVAEKLADGPGRATYQGRIIDLSVSWEGAQVCSVLSRFDVRCYRNDQEATAAAVAERPRSNQVTGGGVSPLWTWHGCPDNYLCLYEHDVWNENRQGRRLQFRDDYWQSLVPFGFDRKTSSWTNNQNNLGCTDTGILGNGAGDDRVLNDCSASASLGSYNDRAVDTHG